MIIPVAAVTIKIKIPNAATRAVGKDLFLVAFCCGYSTACSGSSSTSARAFNRRVDGATQLPLFSSGLVPSTQSAQVPSQVMIWLTVHWSERQTVLSL